MSPSTIPTSTAAGSDTRSAAGSGAEFDPQFDTQFDTAVRAARAFGRGEHAAA